MRATRDPRTSFVSVTPHSPDVSLVSADTFVPRPSREPSIASCLASRIIIILMIILMSSGQLMITRVMTSSAYQPCDSCVP